MMTDKIVQFSEVKYRYGPITALRGISFSLEAGEIFGFIGPNGCGKTTTIRIMLGLYRPYNGSVEVFNKNPLLNLSQIGPKIGMMLEQPGLFSFLTAKEYLNVYSGIYRMCSAVSKLHIDEALSVVGLENYQDRRTNTFSKGMKQRLSLARCLLNHPELIILDEPFDGIDAETRRKILQLLPMVSRTRGTTVFITSHNLREIELICDRIAIVKNGSILALDRRETLCNQDSKRFVLIEVEPGQNDMISNMIPPGSEFNDSQNLIRIEIADDESRNVEIKRILDKGIRIKSINEHKTSLEDIYFSMTDKDQ